MRNRQIYGLFALVLFFSACEKDTQTDTDKPYVLQIPAGFPVPEIPNDNLLTEKRVQLGNLLFFDRALSADSTVACASCHLQSLAFSDGKALSSGVHGALGFRNAPSLGNVAYHPYFLRDGGVSTLEQQVFVPVGDTREMAFSVEGVVERMKQNTQYLSLSETAYHREPDAFVLTRALAAYQRTLITGNSRFDRFYFQDVPSALSESEQRGFQLFESSKTHCSRCHSGFDFTDYTFRNIGLYEVYADTGRKRITLLDDDYGKFVVPSLRNVELTAPYMHDGSIATLEDALEHFNSGGKETAHKDSLIQPLNLTANEKRDLLNFLKTLTDVFFIENEEFAP